jgi:signal transduction histidine kinase
VFTRQSRGVAYVAAQNALAIAVVWVSHGRAELAPLPIISECFMALTPLAGWSAAGLHAASYVVLLARTQEWSQVLVHASVFMSAEVFVIAFTAVARAERRARTELSIANERLATQAAQTEELATTKERNRVARELHDSLGHYLTVLHVQLSAAESQFELDPERAQHALTTARRIAHEMLEDVRTSVAQLRTSPLDQRPLPSVLSDLVNEVTASGMSASLSLRGTPRRLPPLVELTLFRTAQETLTNAQRHSGAREVTVDLAYQNGSVTLSVSDDGRGSIAVPTDGFGLMGLRERARLVGGDFAVEPNPGFTVTLRVPA